MSRIQSNITRHAKSKKIINYDEDKYQSIEIEPKKTQMIDLVSNNTKIVIIITFHMFKNLEESINILNRDMEDKKVLSRNTRDKDYNSTKEKYTDGINSRQDIAE